MKHDNMSSCGDNMPCKHAGMEGKADTAGDKGKETGKADKTADGHSAKHPGFKAVAAKIASKGHIGLVNAGAILAASSRGASAGAKKANPRLKKVK